MAVKAYCERHRYSRPTALNLGVKFDRTSLFDFYQRTWQSLRFFFSKEKTAFF